MLNPTFFRIDTQDGEMRLQAARLDRVDARTLDDIGLTEAEWASAGASSSVRARLAAFLENLRPASATMPARRKRFSTI
jgi:hypothetical protein